MAALNKTEMLAMDYNWSKLELWNGMEWNTPASALQKSNLAFKCCCFFVWCPVVLNG